LKEKYSADKKLSPISLADKSNEFLSNMKKYLVKNAFPIDSSSIRKDVVDDVRRSVLSKLGEGEDKVTELLKTTEYIIYAPDDEIINYFSKNPYVFFDGKYWKRPYSTLGSGPLKDEVKTTFMGYLNDILWLKKEAKDYNPETITDDIEYRLLRASYSLMLVEAYRE
jgi:hypothetical protein